MLKSIQIGSLALLLSHPVFAAPAPKSSLQEVKPQMNEYFKKAGPKAGSDAPDFELENARGGTLCASALWAKKPVIVFTGSYSCPQFRETTAGRLELFWEFSDRVEFIIIYTMEAHPKGSDSPYVPGEFLTKANVAEGVLIDQPKTYEGRVQRAKETRKTLKLVSDIAVDTMDNATWKKYGSSPNCGYLIGTDGKVVLQQGLFDANEMRAALVKLVGK